MKITKEHRETAKHLYHLYSWIEECDIGNFDEEDYQAIVKVKKEASENLSKIAEEGRDHG
jgi:hypothetical protein